MLITYNHGRYIAQALESVLMQKTDFHFTINVIEDCSTDNTADIIRDYASKYPDKVIPFLNEKNIGFKVTQKNFYRGFKTLNGEYFAILEGDDYWTSPDKLQKQVDFLDRHPEYVICAHNTIKIYEDGSQEAHRFLYYGKQEDGTIEDAIALRTFFHTTGILYRNVFKGIPPRHYINKWSCDIFIGISHAEHGKIFHLDEDMAVYRAHSGGRFSTMTTLDGWKFNIGGLQRYNAWLGFRFMKSFDKSISKYCNVILAESGRDGVARLSLADGLKYRMIKNLYLLIYWVLDIPDRVNRARLRTMFGLNRRLHGHRLQAEDIVATESQDVSRAVEDAGLQELSASSPGLTRMPLKSRMMMFVLSKMCAVLKVKMSDSCLPSIESFGPTEIMPGEGFNTQPDGGSAMWLRVKRSLPAQTRLILNGTALVTVVDDRLVTAAVPAHLTMRPSRLPIWLESDDADGKRISDPVFLHVTAPARGKNSN